jgi:hypothetical protein
MGKSETMTVVLEGMSSAIFGRSREECISSGVCVKCGGPACDFTDGPSLKEFSISGFCQKCQDEIFSE